MGIHLQIEAGRAPIGKIQHISMAGEVAVRHRKQSSLGSDGHRLIITRNAEQPSSQGSLRPIFG